MGSSKNTAATRQLYEYFLMLNEFNDFTMIYNKQNHSSTLRLRQCSSCSSLINDLSQYKQWLDGNIISRFIIELEFVEGKMRTKPNMNLLHQLLANTLFGLVKWYLFF